VLLTVGVMPVPALSIGRSAPAAVLQGKAIRVAFFGLRRRNTHDHAGVRLYGAAVAAARDPFLYSALQVADTIDGRFDLLCLYVSLLIRRLQREPESGPALAQAVFDAMFGDMDANLREMGVGDLSVGRHVRSMWEALQGRSIAYAGAIDAGDRPALEAAIGRNVWRGTAVPASAAVALARLALAEAACLDRQLLTALAAGEVWFVPAEEAAR
jgi:cytochrome b pre-mRNA-processing protein 3